MEPTEIYVIVPVSMAGDITYPDHAYTSREDAEDFVHRHAGDRWTEYRIEEILLYPAAAPLR